MAQMDRKRAGHVAQIWIYPVKSMSGQRLPAAMITADGLVGDRAFSVCDTRTGRTLSARSVPALAEITARTGEGGMVALDVPGETPGLCGAAADAALRRHLGRDVHLVRADAGTFADVAPVHLVSTAAIAAAVTAGQACGPGAAADPRANVIVDLPGGDGEGVERSWVGHELVVGAAVLRVSRMPKHCLGVYAEVLVPGTVVPGAALLVR